MPKGDLEIRITDMRGEPLRAKVEIELQRLPGDAGAGGESSEVVVNMASSTELRITGIACRGGPGTLYKVAANTSHYRTYSFFQSIRESMVNPPSDDIEFWVKPGDVKGIRGPKFSDLSIQGQSILAGARMVGEEKEDEDLVGLQGASLYSRLGPLRQACLLNILKKADHFSSARCLKDFQELLVCRQDRFFAFVRPQLPARLAESPKFKSAPGTLHKPMKGFRMSSNGSFKSRDPLHTPMVLVAGHGAFTWGETPEKAIYNATVLEELARMAFVTHTLDPRTARLPDRLIRKHFERKHGKNAYYGQK